MNEGVIYIKIRTSSLVATILYNAQNLVRPLTCFGSPTNRPCFPTLHKLPISIVADHVSNTATRSFDPLFCFHAFSWRLEFRLLMSSRSCGAAVYRRLASAYLVGPLRDPFQR